MTDPKLTVTGLRVPAEPARVAVLMPGLGTAVTGTCEAAAQHLNPDTHVIALDLPGHGHSPTWHDAGWSCLRRAGAAERIGLKILCGLSGSSDFGVGPATR